MTEFLKSFSSMSIALALLPVRQMQTMLRTDENDEANDPGVKTMDSITSTAIENYRGSLLKAFCALDNAQRGAIAMGARMLWPFDRGESEIKGNPPAGSWSAAGLSGEERRANFRLRL